MVGRLDVSRCCCVACRDYAENPSTVSPFTVESGSWIPDPLGFSGLMTTDSNAALIYQATPAWLNNFRVVGWFGPSSDTPITASGDGGRIYFGWQDSSNYWFYDLIYRGSVPTGGPHSEALRSYELKIEKVVAGLHAVLGSVTVQIGWSLVVPRTPSQLRLCLQGGNLQATFIAEDFAGTEYGALSIDDVPPQGRFGLGSHVPAANPVSWQAFFLDFNGQSAVCAECVNGHCCEGFKLPQTVTLNITGLSAEFAVWNGAYIVPFYAFPISYLPASGWPTHLGCAWTADNVLPNPYPGRPGRSYLFIGRDAYSAAADDILVALYYEYTDGLNPPFVEKRATGNILITDPFTISPCHDQWANPLSFSGGGTATITGNV